MWYTAAIPGPCRTCQNPLLKYIVEKCTPPAILSSTSCILGERIGILFGPHALSCLKSMQNWRDPSFFHTSTTALHQGDWLGQMVPASNISLRDAWTSSNKGGGMHLKCNLNGSSSLRQISCLMAAGTSKLIRFECKGIMIGEQKLLGDGSIAGKSTHSIHQDLISPTIFPVSVSLVQSYVPSVLAHPHLVLRALPRRVLTLQRQCAPLTHPSSEIWHFQSYSAPLSILAYCQPGVWYMYATPVTQGVSGILCPASPQNAPNGCHHNMRVSCGCLRSLPF